MSYGDYLPPPNHDSGVSGIPAGAMAAAIIWILFGALMLLGGAALLAEGSSGFIQLVLAVAFLWTRIRVLLGKASGILGAGIACLIVGGLLALGGAEMLSDAPKPASPDWLVAVIFITAGILVVAGILACVADSAYKACRTARAWAADPSAAIATEPTPEAEPQLSQPPVCPTCRAAMRLDAKTAAWRCEGCV